MEMSGQEEGAGLLQGLSHSGGLENTGEGAYGRPQCSVDLDGKVWRRPSVCQKDGRGGGLSPVSENSFLHRSQAVAWSGTGSLSPFLLI